MTAAVKMHLSENTKKEEEETDLRSGLTKVGIEHDREKKTSICEI